MGLLRRWEDTLEAKTVFKFNLKRQVFWKESRVEYHDRVSTEASSWQAASYLRTHGTTDTLPPPTPPDFLSSLFDVSPIKASADGETGRLSPSSGDNGECVLPVCRAAGAAVCCGCVRRSRAGNASTAALMFPDWVTGIHMGLYLQRFGDRKLMASTFLLLFFMWRSHRAALLSFCPQMIVEISCLLLIISVWGAKSWTRGFLFQPSNSKRVSWWGTQDTTSLL